MLFGNGGSAADAQHIAAEFVECFLAERDPLPAISLSTDTSIPTAWGNDYGFETVYSRQIAALGQPGDTAIAISTSGNSRNVLSGIAAAKSKNMYTVGLTGDGGGKMHGEVGVLFQVPSRHTPRIQETHIMIGHILCELIDRKLFPQKYVTAGE
jgi:D-sedoheptulose 7-phosphate isomerase